MQLSHPPLLHSLAEVKPHLRGWLHLGIVPLTLAGGIVLVALSSGVARAGATVFVLSALLLFGVSAAYHRGTWSAGTWRVLRRLDHCNIFVLIAGSCTAYALILLDARDAVPMLVMVWVSAVIGVAARFVWSDAPRWLSPPIYVGCAWGALVYSPGLVQGAARLGAVGPVTLVLLAVGSVLYVGGAVVYGLQRPDPWPRWFGFHEVFHALTVLAFASHYTGVLLAICAVRGVAGGV
jgi:hemolysin III